MEELIQIFLLEPSSPLIPLSRIIAKSHLPDSNSLKAVEDLETNELLKDHFLVPATRGDIFKRMGKVEKAKMAYQQAMDLAGSPNDKRFLKRKMLECDSKNY